MLDQLWRIYCEEEWWHVTRLPREEFDKYTQKLIDQGNLFYEVVDGLIKGYTEVWLITFEQFGRILCHEPFHASEENITDGSIAYVANVWCDKDYRRGDVTRAMKKEFFARTIECTHFVGEAKRKKTQPVKVFKRKELLGV